MTNQELLILMTAFIVKHFIVDFPMQQKYQYLNKGTFGHPGGILHAAFHYLGTMAVLSAFSNITNIFVAIGLAIFDGVIHYFVDWAKVNINKFYGWTATTSEMFWHLVGLDQLIHYMTYIGIIWYVI